MANLTQAKINENMGYMAYFRATGALVFHNEFYEKYEKQLSEHTHSDSWEGMYIRMFPDEYYWKAETPDPKNIMEAWQFYVYAPRDADDDMDSWDTNPVTAPRRLVQQMAWEVQEFYASLSRDEMLRKITTFYTVVYRTKHPYPEPEWENTQDAEERWEFSKERLRFSKEVLRPLEDDFGKLSRLQTDINVPDLSDALDVVRLAGIQPMAPKNKPNIEGLGSDYEAMEHIPEQNHNLFHQIALWRNLLALDDAEPAKKVIEQLSIKLEGQRNPDYVPPQGQGGGGSIRANTDPLRNVLPQYYAPWEETECTTHPAKKENVEYEYPDTEFRCISCETDGSQDKRPVVLFFSRKVDRSTDQTPYSKVLEGKTNWEIICMMWRGEFMLCNAYKSNSEGLWRTPGLWITNAENGRGYYAKGRAYTYNTLAHPGLQREFNRWHEKFAEITRGESQNKRWSFWAKYFTKFAPFEYARMLSASNTTERILGAHIEMDRTRLVEGPPAEAREAQIWKLCPGFSRTKKATFQSLREEIEDAKNGCQKAVAVGSSITFSQDEFEWCQRYVKLLDEYQTKLAEETDETKYGAYAAGLTELQAQWLLQWAVRKETTELDDNIVVLGRRFTMRQISVNVCGRDLILYTLQDKEILRRGVPLETLIGVVENSTPTYLGTFAKIYLGCASLTQKPFEYTFQSPLAWMSSKTADDVQKFKEHAFLDQGFLTCETQPEPISQTKGAYETAYTYVAHMFDLMSRWELAEKDKAQKEKAEREHHIHMTSKVDSVFNEGIPIRQRSASFPPDCRSSASRAAAGPAAPWATAVVRATFVDYF